MEQVLENICKCLIIYNTIIPSKKFLAINLFGIIFVRKDKTFTSVDLNHERIHTAQMKELLFIGFYIWYIIEWCVNWVKYRNFKKAYAEIKFEKEAYKYQGDLNYLDTRKHFSFLHISL